MALLKLEADFSPLISGVELVKTQLPFAIARTLTLCAQDGQTATRAEENEASVFTLRNDWTTQNTKITPATKDTLTAEVFTDTSNRKTGAPDYLLPQDQGGEKIVHNGRQIIAIPTKWLRAMVGDKGVIPAELRPKALLEYAAQRGRYTTRGGAKRLPGTKVRGMYFFLVTFKSGAEGILGRLAESREAYPMYIFVTHANLRKRLHVEEDVQQELDQYLERNWTRALAETLTNDALRGTGWSVRY